MKVQFKRVKSEDFKPEDKALIETVGRSINPAYDQLETALNRNITVGDNLPFEYKTLDVELDATGVPKANLALTNSLANFKGYQVVRVVDLTGTSTRPTATPYITWDYVNGDVFNIAIQHVAGLPQDVKFRLLLLSLS